MKRLTHTQINTPAYWDSHQTAMDFGLRQQKYSELAGQGDSIIELGCGLSPFLYHANFKHRVGLDYSEKTVEQAEKLYPEVEYWVGDATYANFLLANHFDVSVSGEMIEHLDKPYNLVKEMSRITKPGGKIIISTPILEFVDPEHIWQLEVKDFQKWGFKTEIIKSERFPGRKYIFAIKIKK